MYFQYQLKKMLIALKWANGGVKWPFQVRKNGPHGPVYGKVGNLVTYRVLNRDVVRMAGENYKAPSVKPLVCRQTVL
jgi:hypothetical protein